LAFLKEEFKRTEFEKKNKIRKRERLNGSVVSLIQSIIQEQNEGHKNDCVSKMNSSASGKEDKQETDKS
jgi:hypothetical protein